MTKRVQIGTKINNVGTIRELSVFEKRTGHDLSLQNKYKIKRDFRTKKTHNSTIKISKLY